MIPLVNGQVRACAQFGVCLVSITGRHQADSADAKEFMERFQIPVDTIVI